MRQHRLSNRSRRAEILDVEHVGRNARDVSWIASARPLDTVLRKAKFRPSRHRCLAGAARREHESQSKSAARLAVHNLPVRCIAMALLPSPDLPGDYHCSLITRGKHTKISVGMMRIVSVRNGVLSSIASSVTVYQV